VWPESAIEPEEHAHNGAGAALQAARSANPEQVPQESPQIERTGVNEEALEDVGVSAKVCSSHAAGLVHMREGTLDAYTAEPL